MISYGKKDAFDRIDQLFLNVKCGVNGDDTHYVVERAKHHISQIISFYYGSGKVSKAVQDILNRIQLVLSKSNTDGFFDLDLYALYLKVIDHCANSTDFSSKEVNMIYDIVSEGDRILYCTHPISVNLFTSESMLSDQPADYFEIEIERLRFSE